MCRWLLILLACVVVGLSGCERIRGRLPETLARHLPGAEAAGAAAPESPAGQPVTAGPPPPVSPVTAPEVAKGLPVAPQVSLVDSLLAAGSVAGNLLQPGQPAAAAGQPVPGGPAPRRSERAIAMLRSAGVAVPDGAVRDDGDRLVLTLEAADADHFEEELVTQWALGFAVLDALGAQRVAVVTAVDGTPMVEISASAGDIQQLAAEAIDTGEFFRRARFARLGPAPVGGQEADVEVNVASDAAEAAAVPPAKVPAKVRASAPARREPAVRAPGAGRAGGAGGAYPWAGGGRAGGGRAPR